MKYFSVPRYALIHVMAVSVLFVGMIIAGLVHAQGTLSGEINAPSEIPLMTGQVPHGANIKGEEPGKDAGMDRSSGSGNGNSSSDSRSSAGNSGSAGNDEANPGGGPVFKESGRSW